MPRRGSSTAPPTPPVAMPPQERVRRSLSDLILRAVYLAPTRKGASFAFVKKSLAAEGYDPLRNGARLKAVVGSLLAKGLLRRVTGSGMAGSFRIGRIAKERLEATRRRRRTSGKASRSRVGKAKGPKRGGKAAGKAGGGRSRGG